MKLVTAATRIASALPEVTPAEWRQWVRAAEEAGIHGAIGRALKIAADVTVRPSLRRANRLIATAVEAVLAEGLLDGVDFKAVASAVGIILGATMLRGALSRMSCRCGHIFDKPIAVPSTVTCPRCGSVVIFTTDPAPGGVLVDVVIDAERDKVVPVYLIQA